MNVLAFTGNLGRDVQTNNVGGTAVANFAVTMKSGFGDKEQTVWVDCALWGKRAEGGLIQYLTKGQQVAVHGEMGTREYQANDGTNRTAITCRVTDVTLIGGKAEGGGQRPQPAQPAQAAQQQAPAQQAPAPAQQAYSAPSGAMSDDSDIPFMRWPNIMGG